MKKIIPGSVALAMIIVLLIIMIGYHLLSPKVVVRNNSNRTYDQLIIKMPMNRLSFGPIAPAEKQTIYYSFQNVSGLMAYQLKVDDEQTLVGSKEYDANTELAKVIEFVITDENKLEVNDL
jgi:hypothetical protein